MNLSSSGRGHFDSLLTRTTIGSILLMLYLTLFKLMLAKKEFVSYKTSIKSQCKAIRLLSKVNVKLLDI